MSDSAIGATGGAQNTQLEEVAEAKNREISLADLMLLTLLDRAETLEAQIRIQTEVVERQNNQIKQLNQLSAKLAHHKTQPENVPEPTWSVDSEKTPQELLLDNGNKLVFEGKDNAWSIVDAQGNSTRISGDLNVDEADGSSQWDFGADSTFILDDGTKIHVTTKSSSSMQPGWKLAGVKLRSHTHSLTITKGNQSVQVGGISDNKPVIGRVDTTDGKAMDLETNDGHVFTMGDQGDDWLYEGKDLSETQRHYGVDVKAFAQKISLRTDKTYETNKEELEKEVKILATVDLDELMTDSERQLLKDLNIRIYSGKKDALTIEEIQNLHIQIKDARDSISSLSNIDLTKLDAYNKKYTQSLDLASGFMKSQYEQAKSLIRNIN